MKRKRLKKGLAYLLTIAMVAGVVRYIPNDMSIVYAAGNTPSITAYATKDQLMNWDYQNTVGKIVFGKDGSGNPMEWYILGKDDKVDDGNNTVIFAASPIATSVKFNEDWLKNKTYQGSFGTYQNDEPTEVYPNHYGASDLRVTLNNIVKDNNYFTDQEQSLLLKTQVTTTDTKNNTTYTTSDILYALHGDCYNNDTTLYAGSDNDKELAMRTYWNTGDGFWLRAPYVVDYSFALVAFPGIYVDDELLGYPSYAVQPASNLNLTSVIFASAAPAASSDTVVAGTIRTGKAMTLRLDGSSMDIGNVIYDSAQSDQIFVKKSANATGTVSLVVQGNDGGTDWYYSKVVTGAEVIRMADIKDVLSQSGLSLSADISVEECEIWMETTVDGITYAKPMTNGIYIDEVAIMVDAPTPGIALASEVTVQNAEVESISPVIKWTVGTTDATGTAEYNAAYTATMNFTTGDVAYIVDDLTATVNGDEATIIKNEDGTVTVSYTFPATGMGTINYTATGYEGIYDGQGHGITVTVSAPADAKITYSTDGVTYNVTNPIFTDVNGDGVAVYYRIEKDNYITVEGSEIVKIGKRELVVTASDQTITYGDSIDTGKYTVSGLLDGHSINAVTLTSSTMEVTENGTIAVSFDKIVEASGNDVTANYDVKCVEGKLVIKEKEEEKDDTVVYEIEDDKPKAPDTGDKSNVFLWILLFLGSGLVAYKCIHKYPVVVLLILSFRK